MEHTYYIFVGGFVLRQNYLAENNVFLGNVAGNIGGGFTIGNFGFLGSSSILTRCTSACYDITRNW